MRLLAWASASFAVFAFVLAPYTVVVSTRASAINLKSLPVSNIEEGSCQKGAVVKLSLADGRLVVLGDNDRAILAEPSNEASGYPVVTLGVWNKDTGELTLHEKTKHQAQPGDSLCRDVYPEAS